MWSDFHCYFKFLSVAITAVSYNNVNLFNLLQYDTVFPCTMLNNSFIRFYFSQKHKTMGKIVKLSK